MVISKWSGFSSTDLRPVDIDPLLISVCHLVSYVVRDAFSLALGVRITWGIDTYIFFGSFGIGDILTRAVWRSKSA